MCVCVCVCVCDMETYISDSMLYSINDKLENILEKGVFTEHVSLYCITFTTVKMKRNVFLCCVLVDKNVAFVFELT